MAGRPSDRREHIGPDIGPGRHARPGAAAGLRAHHPLQRRRALLPGGGGGLPRRVQPAPRHLRAGSQGGLVPRGQVTKDVIATWIAPPGTPLYLRYVQEPLTGISLARSQTRAERPHFRAPGRLARVGLFGRLVDAGFNASLLARGTVPGGTAAAAQLKYAAHAAADRRRRRRHGSRPHGGRGRSSPPGRRGAGRPSGSASCASVRCDRGGPAARQPPRCAPRKRCSWAPARSSGGDNRLSRTPPGRRRSRRRRP